MLTIRRQNTRIFDCLSAHGYPTVNSHGTKRLYHHGGPHDTRWQCTSVVYKMSFPVNFRFIFGEISTEKFFFGKVLLHQKIRL